MAEDTNIEEEISCKILCLGPRGAGKTSNLLSIKEQVSHKNNEIDKDLRSYFIEQRGLYYKFLPLKFDAYKNGVFRLHLFSCDLPLPYKSLQKLLWQSVDAFFFVYDSQVSKMGENLDFLQMIKKLSLKEGYNLQKVPQVIQYNKRDLNDLADISLMQKYLNPYLFSNHEAIANKGEGTMNCLSSLCKQLLKLYDKEDLKENTSLSNKSYDKKIDQAQINL